MGQSIYQRIRNYISKGEIRNAYIEISKVLHSLPHENRAGGDFIKASAKFEILETNYSNLLINFGEYTKGFSLCVQELVELLDRHNKLFPGSYKSQPRGDADYDYVLQELGKELSFNYYSVSFGSRFDGQDFDYMDTIFRADKFQEHKIVNGKSVPKKPYEDDAEPRRNILLIGAGATVASCPYVPTSKRVKDYLEEKYPEFKAAGSRIPNDNFPNFDTEFYLSSLHKKVGDTGKEVLRDALNKIYDVRYLPTHFYEIVAHMVKHSFFDVVINFNFDELLDRAIAEELGRSEYIKVVTSSDCKEFDDIFIDGRLKTPVYIKIQGTASDKASLRFTGDNHFDVPADIQDFITKWLRGDMPKGMRTPFNKVRTNVVCVGFDPERFDFIRFIKGETLHPKSKWFHINYENRPFLEKMGLHRPFIGTKEDGSTYERWIPTKHWKEPEQGETNSFIPALANIFSRLWHENIREAFNSPFRPRNIARHEIVADIFYHAFEHNSIDNYKTVDEIDTKYEEMRGYFRSSDYYLDRTVVEILISIGKNKGIVEPEQVVHERIGVFYQQYLNECIKKKENTKKYFKIYSLKEIFSLVFNLAHEYHYTDDLLNLALFSVAFDYPNDNLFNNIRHLGYRGGKDIEEISSFFNAPQNMHLLLLYRFFRNPLNLDIIRKLETRFKIDHRLRDHIYARLTGNIDKLRDSFTYDIKPRFDDPEMLRFESIDKSHILHTNLSLSYQFAETFNTPSQWDTALIVSERGKFLNVHFNVLGKDKNNNEGFIEKLSNKKIIMLTCHEARLATKRFEKSEDTATIDVLDSLKEKGVLEVSSLPYWQHYYHIVMFLKKQNAVRPGASHFSYNEEQCIWEVVTSFYYYKPGFSNQINPVLFPVSTSNPDELAKIQKDQEWLLSTFYAYYEMSKQYEKSSFKNISIINPGSIEDKTGLQAFLRYLGGQK